MRILTSRVSYIIRYRCNLLIVYRYYIVLLIGESDTIPALAKQEFRNHLMKRIEQLSPFKLFRAQIPISWRTELAEELRQLTSILS